MVLKSKIVLTLKKLEYKAIKKGGVSLKVSKPEF